jgi:dihydroflavonol-4-reductase
MAAQHEAPQEGQPAGRRGRTAFVTGATGFLGRNLVEQLVGAGWRVIALHRPTSDLTMLKRFPVEGVVGTIEDPVSLEKAMPAGVDAVFHLAADVSFWSRHNQRQTRTNVDGTRHVVAAARNKGARRLICTSSTSVYGLPRAVYDETAPHLGKGSWFHYQHTKALAEEEVRQGIAQGLEAVLLNPANIVGPYDKNNWAKLIRLAVERRLPRVPPGRASFCHAVEVARAHIAAVDRGRSGENYILGGADASYLEVVQTIGEVVGQPVNTRVASPLMMRLGGRLFSWVSWFTGREPLVTPESAAFLSADLVCRSDKAVRELGYRPQSLRTMLADCYAWMVAEGILPAKKG